MHEISLAQSLIRQVEELKKTHAAGRVVRFRVSVGEMAGVIPELLRSALEMLEPELVEALELIEVPLEAHCQACSQDFRVERFSFRCPQCSSQNVIVLRGEHVILESVTFREEGASDGPT